MRISVAVALGAVLVHAAGSACRLAEQPESDPRFKHFLEDTAQTVAFLAHPTDIFDRASVDDTGLLTVETRSSRDDSPRVLEVRVRLDPRSDVERLWVVRDTASFPGAFTGLEIIRGYVMSALERDERAPGRTDDGRRQIRRFRQALETMDGRQIAEEFVRLQWRFARAAG